MAHFDRYMKETKMDVQMEYLGDQQLLALQVSNSSLWWGEHVNYIYLS